MAAKCEKISETRAQNVHDEDLIVIHLSAPMNIRNTFRTLQHLVQIALVLQKFLGGIELLKFDSNFFAGPRVLTLVNYAERPLSQQSLNDVSVGNFNIALARRRLLPHFFDGE